MEKTKPNDLPHIEVQAPNPVSSRAESLSSSRSSPSPSSSRSSLPAFGSAAVLSPASSLPLPSAPTPSRPPAASLTPCSLPPHSSSSAPSSRTKAPIPYRTPPAASAVAASATPLLLPQLSALSFVAYQTPASAPGSADDPASSTQTAQSTPALCTSTVNSRHSMLQPIANQMDARQRRTICFLIAILRLAYSTDASASSK
ncbi:uncharacterized protein MONOS_14053 [Monocercomonoides exilis]|uniref:uncharacterized protein n=1 Tax=Monocercomonoides exilis TaxID=2049356 RepID=UPI0035595AEE|nr:hypothetical protein MONOS_14053 [Monocercomonoides exilis]|eukprot:MONOS_14053.1-p1 / transcript=MONOS_14053.1 / gene=MONOS_14053 / organism=Monocercomonoides_exilis_PA203 / gene_product=unspecified product / transcript_product=unspecified product / location=Mono_scaffold00928:7379-8289(+) / protein_length=201 / sequence_SO=supercontig / SO=protein_coding / is_pseudo=false